MTLITENFLLAISIFFIGTLLSIIISKVSKIFFKKIEKMEFSLANIQDFLNELKNKKISNLIVCGIETHICIQQTVLDCLQKGFEVILISDAMGSRNRVDHEIALQRMTQSGAILTTTESIIFELCKTADRKEFKEVRNIIMS